MDQPQYMHCIVHGPMLMHGLAMECAEERSLGGLQDDSSSNSPLIRDSSVHKTRHELVKHS